ncbi:MAG TPA: helix-turn-helix domain-containing protein [Gemmatimonadaceae bacterium]|jgi:AraC-like DNA-binding protein
MPGPTRTLDLDAPIGVWQLHSAAPDQELATSIVELWEVHGTLRPFRETLLPNGAAEIMFNLGPVHELHSDQGRGLWTDAWISGLHERSLIIESLNGTHLVSARLHPLGAVQILGRSMASVANSVVKPDAFFTNAADMRDELLAAKNAAERFVILERLVGRLRYSIGERVPDFLWQATRLIDARHGNLKISELHDDVGVSRRHLSVMFSRYIGISPKRYAAIKRFTWTFEHLRGQANVDWSKLASDAGYSDQSHLVRDFKRVGAATPTEYLRLVTPDAAALIDDAAR